MRFLTTAQLAMLSPAQVEALDDLEHGCDLISTLPTLYEVAWTLSRAGAPSSLCQSLHAAA